MRILILTTETPHHIYFVEQLSNLGHEIVVVEETGYVSPPYETYHYFETQRDQFETKTWFNGCQPKLGDFTQVYRFNRVNDSKCVDLITRIKPDIVFVFGTQLLSEAVIEASGNNIFNFHGGNASKYRGLDSHLWAIWHEDFDAIVTTLHQVEKGYDTGPIFDMKELKIEKIDSISKLRYWNTLACKAMALEMIQALVCEGEIKVKEQLLAGRYYSFMPSTLKQICVDKFQKFLGAKK